MAEQTAAPAVLTPRLRLREQERAHAAITAVAAVPEAQRAAYLRRAQGLPAMIQNLGLAGTIAFLLSKEQVNRLVEPEDRRLVTDLSAWLLDDKAGVGWPTEAKAAAAAVLPHRWLEEAITHQQTSILTYRRATTEAKRYATWLKRWSKAATASPTQGA